MQLTSNVSSNGCIYIRTMSCTELDWAVHISFWKLPFYAIQSTHKPYPLLILFQDNTLLFSFSYFNTSSLLAHLAHRIIVSHPYCHICKGVPQGSVSDPHLDIFFFFFNQLIICDVFIYLLMTQSYKKKKLSLTDSQVWFKWLKLVSYIYIKNEILQCTLNRIHVINTFKLLKD